MAAQSEPEAAPPPQPVRPIFIIKRKKAGHAGHHGGAWKVAYADFVTAMMALFMVLWLMGADDKIKEAISAFFNNPTGPGTQTGTNAAGAGNAIQLAKDDMAKLREKMEQALKTMPNFREMKDHVEMTITSDGLRIELLETQAGMFFESGRPLPSATGAELLTRLAEELGKMPNDLLIEGHTDAKPFVTKDGFYSNWELATDRANAARRLMEAHGIRSEQVAQVRGYAARQLRHPEDPENAANRRISVIVQYVNPPPSPAKAVGEAPKAAGEPAKVVGEPAKVAGEAPKAAAEPAKAAAEAPKAPGEPAKAAPPAHK
ncbi:MAG: OmpA family protein [Candidatus Solibacter sp.]|nr:OmpA family protein [Candidatus Solibacter sp.]